MDGAKAYVYLEKLIQLATGEAYLDPVREAKARYFKATGEVFEDDPFFEPRMNGFVEYYLFDWPAAAGGKSTTALVIERGRDTLPEEELKAFVGFDRSIHSIFEYKKQKGERITVENLFDGEKYEVEERRALAGLSKGDIFEARLLPFGDRIHFSNAFIFHPREVRKFIAQELKNARAGGMARATEVIHRLAYLRLKFDRFRRVDATRIYSRDTLAQIEAEAKREAEREAAPEGVGLVPRVKGGGA